MTRYTLTDEQTHAAAMAGHAAADLIPFLAQMSDAYWLSPSQVGLRAEWAFAAYDKLVEWMASLPRPDRPEARPDPDEDEPSVTYAEYRDSLGHTAAERQDIQNAGRGHLLP
jgi:hypothetical protein